MRNKATQLGFTLIELVFGLWALFCVAAVIGLVIAICHFVAKFW